MLPDPEEELRKKTEGTSRKREVADCRRAHSERGKALQKLKVQQRSQHITILNDEADKPGKNGKWQDNSSLMRRRTN